VIDDLLGKGIDVVSATEPHMDSTTPQGRLMRNIFASVAEYERELIRERVIAGLRHAQAHGTRSGRPIGRPRRASDLDEVRLRRAAGEPWRKIARALKVPARTLRRYAREAGQNPPGELSLALPPSVPVSDSVAGCDSNGPVSLGHSAPGKSSGESSG